MDDSERISILIVDDDTMYLDILRDLLQDTYVIHVAQTGPSAIMLAEEVRPDVILLDVVIPGMTGYEVFSALQENEATRHIPVIFISGLTDMEEQEKGYLLGAAEYVQKPCGKVVLHAKIETQLKIVEYSQIINQIGLLDPLTGLPLRRRFIYRLNEEWRRNCRTQTAISLLLIDIDNFRDFNQKYGYLLGDAALKQIGLVCKNSVHRPADTAATLGGGMFALLLPGTDDSGAAKIAQDVLLTAEDTEIIPLNSEKAAKLTVSIGIATLTPKKEDLQSNGDKIIDDFMSAALEKLQEAKASGKNRIAQ
jgi:diguanylate cyclase (GGDEF)-like protein